MSYPQKLVSYLEDYTADRDEVYITQSEDSTLFIIKHNNLNKWLTVIEWYDGQQSFETTKICGPGFDRLYKIMTECLQKKPRPRR